VVLAGRLSYPSRGGLRSLRALRLSNPLETVPLFVERTLLHPGSSSSSAGEVDNVSSWGGEDRLRRDIEESLLFDFLSGGECNEDANDIGGGPSTIESPPIAVSRYELELGDTWPSCVYWGTIFGVWLRSRTERQLACTVNGSSYCDCAAWGFLRSIGCIHWSICGSDSGLVTRGDSCRASNSSIV
jgi:hypothetical protein